MRHLLLVSICLLFCPARAQADPHVVGVYTGGDPSGQPTGADDPVYHVDVRGLDAVEMGSVLIAYRRVPAARGDATFREDPVWMESGRLKVIGLGEQGWAVGRMVAGPPFALPALDDDGVPRDRICIGDRLVDTGTVGAAAESVVGHFEHELLFLPGSHELRDEGFEVLRLWLSRFAVGGGIRVDVGIGGPRAVAAGRVPATHERLARTEGPDGIGRAEVRGSAEEASLAQRRAARLRRLVTEILGVDPSLVLATTSWPDESVTDTDTVTIRMLDAVPLAELSPGEPVAPGDGPMAGRGRGETR